MIQLRPPHLDLTFMTPLSEQRAGTLVGFLVEGLQGGTVVDLGCGWAELLLRTLAARPDARGIGVDSDEPAIEHGRDLARRRGLADRVKLVVGDARALSPRGADAVICIGASQIWGPPVEDAQPLDYSAALGAVRALVPRGGRAIFGEGVWSRPPTSLAVAPLSGRPDELVSLPDLVELAVAHGFLPLAVHEANQDEWDEFESGYSACYAVWLAEHGPDDTDRGEVLAMAARQRKAYYGGYRGVMGMAYLSLVAV